MVSHFALEKGGKPHSKIPPMEIITPVVIARSERGVNLEMGARPTGKKASERVACRIRAKRRFARSR